MSKLVWYGGDGYGGCKENALYQVKHDSGHKYFGKLSEAKKYFDDLNEGKALWNIDIMELIECYTLEE